MTYPNEDNAQRLNEAALQRLLLQASARETEQVVWAYRAYLADLLAQGAACARHLRYLIRCFEGVQQECAVMVGSLQWRLGEGLINRVKRVLRRPRTTSESVRELTALQGHYLEWKNGYVAQTGDALARECRQYVTQGVASTVTGEAVEIVGQLAHASSGCAAVLEQRRADIVALNGLIEALLAVAEGLRANLRFKLGYGMTCQADKLRSLTPSSAGFLARLQGHRQAYGTWKTVYFEELGKETVFLPAPPAPLLEALQRIESDAVASPGAAAFLQGWRETAGTRHQARQVRIIQATPPMPRNPYYTLLSQSLQAQGFHIDFTDDWEAIAKLIAQQDARKTVLHLHQLDVFYHDAKGSEAVTKTRAAAMLAQLAEWKAAGVALVWTKHNPYPHVDRFRAVDEEVNAAVAALADQVIVLGQAGVTFTKQYVDETKITVLPHPSFAGVYGPPVPRAVARKRLGLPEDVFLFGNVGEIRGYKGLEALLAAVGTLREGGANVAAVIAGQPGPDAYIAQLQEKAGSEDRIHTQEIAAGDMACWLGALDVAVFPFTAIWGSSSVVLALSYGVPVVTPDTGMLPDYVQEGDTGFLYDPAQEGAMLEKMQEAMDCPWGEHLRYMSDRFNERHAVPEIAQALATCYRHCDSGKG